MGFSPTHPARFSLLRGSESRDALVAIAVRLLFGIVALHATPFNGEVMLKKRIRVIDAICIALWLCASQMGVFNVNSVPVTFTEHGGNATIFIGLALTTCILNCMKSSASGIMLLVTLASGVILTKEIYALNKAHRFLCVGAGWNLAIFCWLMTLAACIMGHENMEKKSV